MNILFEEAVEALENVRILTSEHSDKVLKKFVSSFPFESSGGGRIDWKAIDSKVVIDDINDIRSDLTIDLSSLCFIIWNDASLPVLESNLKDVISAFDDVTAVSFDTWIFIPETINVIESLSNSLKMTKDS